MNFQLSGVYTDLYQLAMSQAYYLNNLHNKPAAFDYFFRKLPFEGGYVIFAGLADLLESLESFTFSDEDIEYLAEKGFNKEFLSVLRNFKFRGNIYAPKEGEVIFPVEPVLRVEGNMLETQLIETALLNILNFQSLIATKAARIRSVAEDRNLSEFGLRRAQGPGAIFASRAAIIGGFNSTSNVFAGQKYNIPISGTMAHSFVQMFDDELTAFRNFAEANPDNCILLVDTYDTLKSGVPNAITVAKEMEKRGQRMIGIRLDSGDLSYLARISRRMLNEAGLDYVQIAASNQLDEYLVRSLIHQKAAIDIFGVGTSLAVGYPDAALDGVYKLVAADGAPRIKISENIQKTTLPGKKQVFRFFDTDGLFYGADAIAKIGEIGPYRITAPYDATKSMSCKGIIREPLLKLIVENGELLDFNNNVEEIKQYSAGRLALLPPEFKRFENPHIYKVGISPEIRRMRDELRDKYTKGFKDF